ncbi:MAG: hydrogenase/urease accessory protein HupE [Mariniblastus sp.]|jgi:hydrogenase/urease accessory protein HupE
MKAPFVVFGLVLFTWFASTAKAHEMRPGYLEIKETTKDTYAVFWKVPARGVNERLSLHLQFADDVEVLSEPVSAFVGGAHIQRQQIRREGGLTGTSVTIAGLSGTYTDVLLRLHRMDGTEIIRRLTPAQPSYVVEASPSVWQVGWTYFVLGIEHILLGIDHLLFVLALLLIVADWKKLIGTITAFTVAHSITLALATLGFINVPGPPVEAIIALSIVFVAAEIIRGQQGKPGLTARAPWVVAFIFGLLHGFGFAGALSEVGLPQTSIPMALLTFNLGVEAGQLVFVGGLLLAYLMARRILLKLPAWSNQVPAYAIGGIAAFWMIERTFGFWS